MIGHYWSESREEWVAFPDLHDNHLRNAWVKLGRRYYEEGVTQGEQAELAMKMEELSEELVRRGWRREANGWQAPNTGGTPCP